MDLFAEAGEMLLQRKWMRMNIMVEVLLNLAEEIQWHQYWDGNKWNWSMTFCKVPKRCRLLQRRARNVCRLGSIWDLTITLQIVDADTSSVSVSSSSSTNACKLRFKVFIVLYRNALQLFGRTIWMVSQCYPWMVYQTVTSNTLRTGESTLLRDDF